MKTYKEIKHQFVHTFYALNDAKNKFDVTRDKIIKFSLNYDQECQARKKVYYNFVDAEKTFNKAKVAYDNVCNPYHISYYVVSITDFVRKIIYLINLKCLIFYND